MLPQTELRYYFATYFAYTWINHLTCVAGLITHKGFSLKLQRGPKSVLTVGGKEQVAKEMFCWGLASVFLFFLFVRQCVCVTERERERERERVPK